jgi:chitinase
MKALAMVFLLAGVSAHAAPGSRVMGYFPSWTGVSPSQVRYEHFSHIFHAFVKADAKGTLEKSPGLPSAELCRLAHAKGVKVILSLGGAGSGSMFSALMRDPKAVDAYVANVVAMVNAAGYDGLDVDWEHPENAVDQRNLIVLFKKFRAALKPGAVMSMAVAGSDWAGKWLDAPEMLKQLDFINVMSYDAHGPWSRHAGYNSPLYADLKDGDDGKGLHYQAFYDYWTKTKRWPKERLNMGIPCYGYGYAVTAWYQKPSGKSAYSEGMAYKDVPGLLKDGWKSVWDKRAAVPYLKKDGVKELISYDDEASVKLKAEWARKNGAGGIFFWEITQDIVGGDNVLVKAAKEGFLGARP